MTEILSGKISSVDRPYPFGGPFDLIVKTSDYRMRGIRTDGVPAGCPGDKITCTPDPGIGIAGNVNITRSGGAR
jgi:hypothetical protein